MKFHCFGNPENPAMVLVHGVLTPWQIWEESIAAFEHEFYVVVPALDGHAEEEPSVFQSVSQEADSIEDFIMKNLDGYVRFLCGLSMGGAISWEIFRRNNCRIDHLILDGAPLVAMPSLLVKGMTAQYIEIIHKARSRDSKVLENFKRKFLPEIYMDSFLKFADTMEDRSIRNMIQSVGAGSILLGGSQDTFILFFHGSSLNEVYSRKSARRLQARYPGAEIRNLGGYAHGDLTIYHQEELIQLIRERKEIY